MRDASFAFVRAVSWGSLAGGGPFVAITLPGALAAPEWSLEAAWLLAMPIVIAAVVVTLAATLIGLPLTAWLAHCNDEDRMTYVIAGLGFGALLPMALGLALFGNWGMGAFLALPGVFAGTVTGASWGRWRERIADQRAPSGPSRKRERNWIVRPARP